MSDHAFYLTVGWASGLLIAIEVVALWRRARRSRHLTPHAPRDAFDDEEHPS